MGGGNWMISGDDGSSCCEDCKESPDKCKCDDIQAEQLKKRKRVMIKARFICSSNGKGLPRISK